MLHELVFQVLGAPGVASGAGIVDLLGPSRIQFKAQYYLYGLLFLIFDVETVLLYPFAVAYNRLTLFAVLEAVLFVAILAAALVYAWRKGALEWT